MVIILEGMVMMRCALTAHEITDFKTGNVDWSEIISSLLKTSFVVLKNSNVYCKFFRKVVFFTVANSLDSKSSDLIKNPFKKCLNLECY